MEVFVSSKGFHKYIDRATDLVRIRTTLKFYDSLASEDSCALMMIQR